jgi:glyoxylase-like metal-dependent hydrolase (beta-lactamase superfamily II)
MIIMIKSNTLQAIPGTADLEFYPYIRKVDLMSSNSFILSGDEQIAVIDPGALDDQLACLVENITALQSIKPRPVIVYLTHAHLDHCFALNSLRRIKDLGSMAVAAHEIGAKALQEQDCELTLAGLLGKQMAPISVDIKLLSKEDIMIGGELELKLEKVSLSYFTDSLKIRYGPILHSQKVSLGKGEALEIYSMPGHSPDSLCLRAGGLLFTGDLFFAPNPGMAGAYGWNKSDLMKSIYKVMWILQKRNIQYCCSGHGKIVDVETAWAILGSMFQDILSLHGLEEITPQWARRTAIYAEDLMRELDRLFTIIISRLAYISHVLDELEESLEADSLQNLIDIKQIEELFLEFNRFVPEFHKGMKLNWDLVHKAGQIIKKLDLVFESEKLGPVLNRSLLRRANRMLDDYTVTYRGYRPSFYAGDVDINSVLDEILESSLFKPHEEAATIEADYDEDFLLALRTRIAHVSMFEETSLCFNADRSLPRVRMDKERFIDAVIDLMERFLSRRTKGIQWITLFDQDWVTLRIVLQGHESDCLLDAQTWRFFERSFALCGAIIQRSQISDGFMMEMDFLPCESVSLES